VGMPPPGGVAGIREAFSLTQYIWLIGNRGNTSERIAWTQRRNHPGPEHVPGR